MRLPHLRAGHSHQIPARERPQVGVDIPCAVCYPDGAKDEGLTQLDFRAILSSASTSANKESRPSFVLSKRGKRGGFLFACPTKGCEYGRRIGCQEVHPQGSGRGNASLYPHIG